jgi:hypothetical protein
VNWVPTPPQVSVAHPPIGPQVRGVSHTRLLERGWETQFRQLDRHSGTLHTNPYTVSTDPPLQPKQILNIIGKF